MSDQERFTLKEAAAACGIENWQQCMTDEMRIIEGLFYQACFNPKTKKYNHGYLGAYERAQAYLVKAGIINAEECEIL